MFLEETEEQLALRRELRAYFAKLPSPESKAELEGDPEGGPVYRRIVRQMGKDGLLGIGWPKEYGGQGRPPTHQFIFFDEVWRAGAPFPFVTINTVGPTLTGGAALERHAHAVLSTRGQAFHCMSDLADLSSDIDRWTRATVALRHDYGSFGASVPSAVDSPL